MRSTTAIILVLATALSAPAMAQAPMNPTSAMEELVAIDARGWMFNSYDRGSMRNVQVLEQSPDGQSAVVYGEYSYNRGSQGWVKARFDNGQFTCIEFWDFSGRCRGLGRSPSQGIVTGVLALAVVGVVAGAASSGGGSSSGYSAAQRYDDPRDYERNQSPPPPPPPPPRTPPIGGEGGLYGCASPPCW
ncbi:MAG: hypothetical protein NW200_14720 [Hyphomonadaceae bacterium]|nr:hypothetical protein [Hyphomonadaceae bacterium]